LPAVPSTTSILYYVVILETTDFSLLGRTQETFTVNFVCILATLKMHEAQYCGTPTCPNKPEHPFG